MTDKKSTPIHTPSLTDDFNSLSAIDAARLLVSITTGQDVSAEELRARFEGACDDTIVRIVDTLAPIRFDWMDNPRDPETGLAGLLARIPQNLHRKVLTGALDTAFERLKIIGHLQIEDKEHTAKPLEEQALTLGQDFFPALFDAGKDAENTTRAAIRTLVLWIDELDRAPKGPQPRP